MDFNPHPMSETMYIILQNIVFLKKFPDCNVWITPFDPRFHHAVIQEETENHPKNTVLKELQAGYMIHDRLLRPAMVIVSKEKVTVK